MWRIAFQLVLIFFLASTSLVAQQNQPISIDDFPQLLQNDLLSTQNKSFLERSEKLLASFGQEWTDQSSSLFSNKEKIVSIYAQLKKNGFGDLITLQNYIDLLGKMAVDQQSAQSIANWLEELTGLAGQKQKRLFDQFITRSLDLLYLDKLGGKGTTAWFLRNGKWRFEKTPDLLVEMLQGNLVCATSRDSLTIYQTSGKMDFISMLFTGMGGTTGWERFGDNIAEKYVVFQSFKVDLTKPLLEADSALFNDRRFFDRPVLGKFEDQVFNGPPSDRTPYPKFSSYLQDIEIDDYFPGISYLGAIAFEGTKIIGTGTDQQQAKLIFRSQNKNLTFIRSNAFVFSQNRIQSDLASVSIHLDQDSLFHAGLWMRYDHEKKLLNLNRSERGIGDAPFIDSYHQVNIYVESLYWNLNTATLEFKQMEGLGSQSVASIESSRLFSNEVFGKLQGIDDLHPMFVISDYLKQYQTQGVLKLGFLSSFMRKPEEQVVAQLLRLAARGFLSYDAATQTAYVNERFYHFIEAKAGTSDFDVIAIQSVTASKQPNMLLNLATNDLTIHGVEEVVLSKTQGVQLFPENSTIVMKKNRDFAFSGLVRAGLFDFHAKEAVFEYDPFKLNFAFVDSLIFMVKERKTDASAKLDTYVKVTNVLSDLNGTLYIDEPGNKSGQKDLPRYPIFSSKSESYVYFDKNFIQEGTLKRDDFFYVVDPFEIDSLDNFSTDNLRFEGYLTSANIFPVFREPLAVMEDYSLGFEHNVPLEGYPMFDGKGHYKQNIHLSNKGFKGRGELQYLTSTSFSREFVFYPDSVIAMADQVEIKEQRSQPEFPAGLGTEVDFRWNVSNAYLKLLTLREPFNLYTENFFSGTLEILPAGMIGSGLLTFDRAKLQSSWYDFFAQSFQADTADFRLHAMKGEKEAFMANDYRTFVDYHSRQAKFTHLNPQSKLSFPYNQYYCTLDEAIWLMDDQRIMLNNNKVKNEFDFENMPLADIIDLDLKGSEFVSEHPDQDSLSFFCLNADYDLNNYAIVARNVKIIRVADAAIFPNDGVITILGEAKMKPLESATIITNVDTKMHQIFDAMVTISSSKNYYAAGRYSYSDLNGRKFVLKMPEITVSKEGNTQARAVIQPADDFYLNPWFAFAGEALLDATLPYLRFKGGIKISHSCFEQKKPWVLFDTIVDPMNVAIPINEGTRDVQGGRISNGLYYATVNDSYYAAFLQEPKGADRAAAFVPGLLMYDRESTSYIIVDQTAVGKRNLLSLNTSRCIVEGKAPIDLELRLGHVQLDTYGSFLYKMIPDSLYLDVFAKIQFPFDEKLLGHFADSLAAANLPGAALNQGNYLFAIKNIAGNEELEKLTGEIALYGSPRKVPDYLQQGIVFSDLKMKWNPETRSFVSTGPFGIANVLKSNSSKLANGFVEIEKSRAADGLSFYFMLNSKQWFFFSYKSGIMQALSSSEQFNTDLMKIKQEKRVVNDPALGGRYEYIIATRRKMVDFLRKMQEAGL